MSLDILEGVIPDEAPATSDHDTPGLPDWFSADYPYSTEEHPYGFFNLPNGEPDYTRPRKRRPHGKRESTGAVATSARADTSAKTAAAMLARLNTFVGLSLGVFGMDLTRDALLSGNDVFQDMAYEALLTDPALARKILSAGASSGKAQLTMAYVMLGGAIAPVGYGELKRKRAVPDEAGASD